ncbi:uncharacterized protein LY79DRAFT_584659 [Colletotrichum navitas]|uniref:Uncharacterized protein n=1 Tax=Colletotrichum navitas TaxID=681940 RepID=A0AAD8PKM0_9PEZI|nr:uncharacterized protein LY79DRAFT_584659 [Colletotrichum navitas]KAK1569549.1 hypothetical protein LY79DRAFT_584659 [Colletotrichum navitas]
MTITVMVEGGQAQGPLTPSRPRRLATTGPVGGGAQTVAVEALNDAMLRYHTATQELVNISINEMLARSNLHKVLFQRSTSGRGAELQRVLTPRERANSARALIVSLAADTDDSEAASRLPMPDEGDFGPLRRLVKLHVRRRQVVTEMRRLAVLVRLGLEDTSLAGDGVTAEAWRQLINGVWEPDMPWLGVM